MTLYKPTLQINRLAVYKSGRSVYDQKFHSGVNIIRGANSTGKSTIADFIFFVLGGDITKWKPEAAGCDFVVAEVKMNEALVTLRRKISEHRNQPMDVFWGRWTPAWRQLWQVGESNLSGEVRKRRGLL